MSCDLSTLRVLKLGPSRKRFGGVVRPEPDAAEAFPDANSVDEALRFLVRITRGNEDGYDNAWLIYNSG